MKDSTRRIVNFLIVIAIALVLVIYMITYTVRFDEVAVKTRFGKADENAVIVEPGIYFKWFAPIENVTVYSNRAHILESRSNEIITADEVSIIVKLAVTWRVEDPLLFYRSLRTVAKAETEIRSQVSALNKIISSEHTFDSLVNEDPSQVRLTELEDSLTSRLQNPDESPLPGFGVAVDRVAVVRLILPQDTTGQVFAQMIQERQTLATETRRAGEAVAQQVRTEAESARDRITAFADLAASSIIDEGRRESSQYYAVFAEHPEFAQLLKTLEFMENSLGNNTTFIFNANEIGFDRVLDAAASRSESE